MRASLTGRGRSRIEKTFSSERKERRVPVVASNGIWSSAGQVLRSIGSNRRILPVLAIAISLGFLNAPGLKPRMSWRSHGKDNEDLVRQLKKNGLIQSYEVERAMLAVDRGDYVPKGASAYADTPLPIGHNATISAPHMHATCLELLKESLFPGARVLDVGSGSGYLVAVMAEMVGEDGFVTGIEHIPELTEQSKVVLSKKKSPQWAKFEVFTADGRKGYPKNAPYDAIHVGAASPDVPQALIDQLNPGGRIVIPVGIDYQGLMLVEKDKSGKIHQRNTMGVMYVPLTDKEKQLSRW